MQLYEDMGDERHKKSPPAEQEEEVTEQFKRDVLAALESNKLYNKVRRLKPGMANYLIQNRAQLARIVKADPNTLKHMLGGARPGTKTRPIERSVYVGRIRRALGLTMDVHVPVRPDRAPVVRLFANLPDDQFRIFEIEIERMTQGS